MPRWDWLPKTAVVCWATSILGKLLLLNLFGFDSREVDHFSPVFDLILLVAAVLTVALLIRWIARRFKKAN